MKKVFSGLLAITLAIGLFFIGCAQPAPAPAPAAQAPAPATAPGPAGLPTPTPTRPQGQGVNGTLTKIAGNTLTLTTAQGQVTVNVGSDTAIQKTITGTLSYLSEGQSLTVIGPRDFNAQDANGAIRATLIIIRPQGQGAPSIPPAGANTSPSGRPSGPGNGTNPTIPSPPRAPRGRGANGTLTNIVGNTLTLATTQGQVTVNASPNTPVQKTVTGTLSDLSEGQSLIVIGTRDANGNITAASIMVMP